MYEEDGFPKMTAPMIEPLAQALSAARKANGRARSSFVECLARVDQCQCARLGNDPRYCVEVNPSAPLGAQHALSETSPMIKPCAGCGAPVQQ